MLSKQEQLKKVKIKTDLTTLEKNTYFIWIKENKTCLICGEYPEIHHVTNKTIQGKRRLHSRVIPLCFNHHSAQSSTLSIHNDTPRFYKEKMSLAIMLEESKLMYEEFLNVQDTK